jgi:hypothetical protein
LGGPDGAVLEGWLQPQAKPLSCVLSISLFHIQVQVQVEVLVRKSYVVDASRMAYTIESLKAMGYVIV